MAYRMKYDSDSDVLSVVLRERGKLSHADEVGDVILHVDKEGRPLFFEVLNASKVVPKMVQALARGEVVA